MCRPCLCVCVRVCALMSPAGWGVSLYGSGPQVNILFKLLHTLYNAIFHSHAALSSGDRPVGPLRAVLCKNIWAIIKVMETGLSRVKWRLVAWRRWAWLIPELDEAIVPVLTMRLWIFFSFPKGKKKLESHCGHSLLLVGDSQTQFEGKTENKPYKIYSIYMRHFYLCIPSH